MRLEYSLTEQDYIKYNIDHLYYSEVGKKSLRSNRYFRPLLFLVAPFMFKQMFQMPFVPTMLFFAGVYVLWVVFYPKFVARNVARKVDIKKRMGKMSDVLGDRSLDLRKDAIVERSMGKEIRKEWQSVSKIVETADHIYVYISPYAAFIIPMSAFRDENAKNEFLSLINKRSGKTVEK